MQEIIKVKNLSKVFNKPIRGNGLKGMIKTLFSNKKIKFTAVNNISFTINQGEMVAYIGANGAGKSTTIKMMTGILTPTSSEKSFTKYWCSFWSKNATMVGSSSARNFLIIKRYI